VTVTNESEMAVRLVDRHWIITDANGRVQEVKGVGVVGETPIIHPGESHQYNSFCPLATEFGSMSGSYGMVFKGGLRIRAKVGTFSLIQPHAIQ
jgi:ApaG protein